MSEVQRPAGTGRQVPTKLTRSLWIGVHIDPLIRRDRIGLDLVDRDLGRRVRVVDGVQHLEESRGAFGPSGFGQGLDHPQRRMGVLAAVFPHAGDIALDIARVRRSLIERRREETNEPVVH